MVIVLHSNVYASKRRVLFDALRIVVQAAPPFLGVHGNAPYWRLTGFDSGLVVGKPVSVLLSVCDGVAVRLDDEQQAVAVSAAGDATTDHLEPYKFFSAVASGLSQGAKVSGLDRMDMSLERLIAASGFGRVHLVQVNTRWDEVDVASGHGNSKGASLTNRCSVDELHCPSIACHVSVAPIVSSSSTVVSGTFPDKDAEQRIGDRAHRRRGSEHYSHRNRTSKIC